MAESAKPPNTQELEAKILEAEKEIESINPDLKIATEASKHIHDRLREIYKLLLQGKLPPQEKQEFSKEKAKLFKDPLYVKYSAISVRMLEAQAQHRNAMMVLQLVKARETRETLPPPAPLAENPLQDATSHLPRSDAQSGSMTSFVSYHTPGWVESATAFWRPNLKDKIA